MNQLVNGFGCLLIKAVVSNGRCSAAGPSPLNKETADNQGSRQVFLSWRVI